MKQNKYNGYESFEVILTGTRRNYIMNELDKINVKYYYFNMVSQEIINELYNCLDLYIVSSRYEGGPRAIFECGLTNTPIISTKVGVAEEFMCEKSLFDVDKWNSYRNAIPNNEILNKNILKLTTKDFMIQFKKCLFN